MILVHPVVHREPCAPCLLVGEGLNVGLQTRNARFDSSVPRSGKAPENGVFSLCRADCVVMPGRAAIRIDPLESAPIWRLRSLERSLA